MKRIKRYTGCVRSVKKGYWHTGKINKTDIYKAVKEEKQKDSTVSISSVLKKLDVSRLGFYDYLKRVPSKTKLRKERITKEIKKIHKESYEIYGSPKITELLNKKGEKVSQKYVYSIMKENNIKAKYIKPYIQTTVSHDFSDKLKNLLNRHYDPTKPNVAWCTDITYIWTYDDGFVYLTSVMDLYSRSIISWVLTKTMDTDEVLKCIENPLVIQSDRGVQYTSTKYRELTSEFIRSYSRKGTPCDMHV